MEHEALPLFPLEAVDLMGIFCRAERAGLERLILAACEHRGPVSPWENAGFNPDRSNLVEFPAVQSNAAFQHLVAKDAFLQILEDLLGLELAFDLAVGQRRDQFVEDLIDAI